MKRKKLFTSLLFLPLLALSGCPWFGHWFGEQDYAKQNQEMAKTLFADQLPNYTWLRTPGGDDAAGTIRKTPCDSAFAECWFVGSPDTWFADGIGADDKAHWLQKLLVIKDKGSAVLQKKISTDVNVKAEAPDIERVLSADAGIDLSKAENVSLSAENMKQVELNPTALSDAIDAKVISPKIVSILKSGSYRIVSQDIRYGSLALEVTTKGNDTLTAALKAKESAAAVVGKDAGLNLTVTHTSDTDFKLTNSTDVVVGYLVKEAIPDIHYVAPLHGFDSKNWRVVQPSRADKKALSDLFAAKKKQSGRDMRR